MSAIPKLVVWSALVFGVAYAGSFQYPDPTPIPRPSFGPEVRPTLAPDPTPEPTPEPTPDPKGTLATPSPYEPEPPLPSPLPAPSAGPEKEAIYTWQRKPEPAIGSFGDLSPLLCTGQYRTFSCVVELKFNHCKNSLRAEWHPLELPGTEQWAKEHRNWCVLTWRSEEATHERKLNPAACAEVMKTLAEGLRKFPEATKPASLCANDKSIQGVLVSTQRWSYSRRLKPLYWKPPYPGARLVNDPVDAAVRLEDVAQCVLHSKDRYLDRKDRKNSRYKVLTTAYLLTCPWIAEPLHGWLEKTLKLFQVSLSTEKP